MSMISLMTACMLCNMTSGNITNADVLDRQSI